jgi:hypothetical protein
MCDPKESPHCPPATTSVPGKANLWGFAASRSMKEGGTLGIHGARPTKGASKVALPRGVRSNFLNRLTPTETKAVLAAAFSPVHRFLHRPESRFCRFKCSHRAAVITETQENFVFRKGDVSTLHTHEATISSRAQQHEVVNQNAVWATGLFDHGWLLGGEVGLKAVRSYARIVQTMQRHNTQKYILNLDEVWSGMHGSGSISEMANNAKLCLEP